MSLESVISNRIGEIKALREQLHRNAELSFKEFNTKKIIEDFLHSMDLSTVSMAGTGVAAVLNQGKECIALRADMDALPVNGVNHVCGHDYHMAVVLGVCRILKDIGYKKCVKFIFQPGEEAEGGALPMIKEGVLKSPDVKNIIGFHVWPQVKIGTIEACAGASMGSVDDFHITFTGKGGHAALPYICKNPIYPAIDFIEAINIKSRIQYDPQNPHVLTVSSIQSGRVPNVIEDTSKVLGTVRTFSSETRKKLYEDIKATCELCAEQYGCKADLFYDFQYPPLISDKALTEKFLLSARQLLGEDKVLPLEKTFAGEDFAFFAEKVPSVHFRLGICDGEKGTFPLHSPRFSASDDAIFYGIYVIVNFLLSL